MAALWHCAQAGEGLRGTQRQGAPLRRCLGQGAGRQVQQFRPPQGELQAPARQRPPGIGVGSGGLRCSTARGSPMRPSATIAMPLYGSSQPSASAASTRSSGWTALRDHGFSARRNPSLLRDGLDVRAARALDAAGRPVVRLTLTNLAGHAYPTGTRRRALRASIGPAASAGAQGVPPAHAVRCELSPGETRTLDLPAAPGPVRWEVRYVRDWFDPGRQSVAIREGLLQEP